MLERLFHRRLQNATPAHERLYRRYEIAYTFVDFSAAMMFLVGSVLFLYPAYDTPAVWLFIVGSAFFAARPTVRLMREIGLARLPLPSDFKHPADEDDAALAADMG